MHDVLPRDWKKPIAAYDQIRRSRGRSGTMGGTALRPRAEMRSVIGITPARALTL